MDIFHSHSDNRFLQGLQIQFTLIAARGRNNPAFIPAIPKLNTFVHRHKEQQDGEDKLLHCYVIHFAKSGVNCRLCILFHNVNLCLGH